MTPLRLVESPAETDDQSVLQLPPGRHGIPADLVWAYQRQRLVGAAAAALAEQGYGRITVGRLTKLARISTSTFYEHFDDLWSCLSVAYETEAEHLCAEVEGACANGGEGRTRARAGIAAALAFLAAEPTIARLLSAEPPPQAKALVAARRDLTERLGALLRKARTGEDPSPPGLERRLIGAALALVSTHVISGESEQLLGLESALSEFLLLPL